VRDYRLYNISSCINRITNKEVYPVFTLVVKSGCAVRRGKVRLLICANTKDEVQVFKSQRHFLRL
jgi:hypothetical protein